MTLYAFKAAEKLKYTDKNNIVCAQTLVPRSLFKIKYYTSVTYHNLNALILQGPKDFYKSLNFKALHRVY